MSKYKLTQKTDANGTTQDIQLDASCVDLSGYVPTSRTINSKALSSNITLAASDVNALPSYSKSISTGAGNPREIRFVRVNYATFDGNNAAYFKIGAMCSHGNGSSYTFLEDIIIGVSATPAVTCTVYKQVQNTSTYTVDGHTVYFGDVYWVVNTTDKYVDFYIIGGQYATLMFTPFTRIGNTVSDTSKIVQYTGSATLYSSGTRVWNTLGNGSLYAKTSDLSGKQDTLVSGTNIKTINNESILGSGNISISGGGVKSITYTSKPSNLFTELEAINDEILSLELILKANVSASGTPPYYKMNISSSGSISLTNGSSETIIASAQTPMKFAFLGKVADGGATYGYKFIVNDEYDEKSIVIMVQKNGVIKLRRPAYFTGNSGGMFLRSGSEYRLDSNWANVITSLKINYI